MGWHFGLTGLPRAECKNRGAIATALVYTHHLLQNDQFRPRQLRPTVVCLIPAALSCFLTACHHAPAVVNDPRIETAQDQETGVLWASINGQRVKIADVAAQFWLLRAGLQLAYSAPDGAGGYENEGQSLWVYSPGSSPRKLLAEKFAIREVRDASTSRKSGLLILMRDGGLGASHLALADPARGEVFRLTQARFLGRDGDRIRVGFQKEDDWEVLLSGQEVPPSHEEAFDLNELLDRAVIQP